MDRDFIAAHLAEAEDHVRFGAMHLARQRMIAARLQQKRAAQEANQAIALLTLFEELQTMRVARRDRWLDKFNKSYGIDS
jgi:hypothetical protein